MRVEQRGDGRGSLKWMQRVANGGSPQIEHQLREAGALAEGEKLDWRSPLKDDGLSEYRDGGFLERVSLNRLQSSLRAFWPERGPQWDGLAVAGSKVFLFEAKAHANELQSSCQAGEASLERIRTALNEVKRFYGAPADRDWTRNHYQYANRLAHLYWLRELEHVDAHLVFIYIVGDREMRGPETIGGWEPAIRAAHDDFGLPSAISAVHTCFVSAGDLH